MVRRMQQTGVLRSLFGMSGKFSLGSFFGVVLLNSGIFLAVLLSGQALFVTNKIGPFHYAGEIALLGSCPLGLWAVISVLIRLFNTIRSMLFYKATDRQTIMAEPEKYQDARRFTYSERLQTISSADYRSSDDGDDPPGNIRVIKPSHNGMLWMTIIVSALIAVFGLWLMKPPFEVVNFAAGLGCIIGPGGFAIFSVFREIVGKPEIRLDDAGFSLVSFGRFRRYRWTDLDKPICRSNAGYRYADTGIQFSLKEPDSFRGRIDKKLTGYSNVLPEYYEGLDLVRIMNNYWQAAVEHIPMEPGI